MVTAEIVGRVTDSGYRRGPNQSRRTTLRRELWTDKPSLHSMKSPELVREVTQASTGCADVLCQRLLADRRHDGCGLSLAYCVTSSDSAPGRRCSAAPFEPPDG